MYCAQTLCLVHHPNRLLSKYYCHHLRDLETKPKTSFKLVRVPQRAKSWDPISRHLLSRPQSLRRCGRGDRFLGHPQLMALCSEHSVSPASQSFGGSFRELVQSCSGTHQPISCSQVHMELGLIWTWLQASDGVHVCARVSRALRPAASWESSSHGMSLEPKGQTRQGFRTPHPITFIGQRSHVASPSLTRARKHTSPPAGGSEGKHLTDSTGFGQECSVRHLKQHLRGFPGGAVVESLPAGAGDAGLSPGLGRSHMPRSN